MINEINRKKTYTIEPALIAQTKTEILKELDKLCRANGIPYFAFGNLLIGCVHYNDVIPGTEDCIWDIGLLRRDYERLMALMKNPQTKCGLFLNAYTEIDRYPRELVSVGKTCTVELPGLKVEQPCWVYLSPFDAIPDDFDFFCGFIRQMRRANRRYSRVLSKYRSLSGGGQLSQFRAKAEIANKAPFRESRRRDRIAAQYEGRGYGCVGRVIKRKSEITRLEKLFPLRDIPFRDMLLSCPRDYSDWTVPMTPELTKQTKEIQTVDIFLLREFDRVCRELNIGYFVCGGTLLGCVRHGGFIPWDDDVDVGMLREDYDRFLKEGAKLLDPRCFLQTRQSDPKIPYLFSKIRVLGTEYITEYNERRDFNKGICLDLFPFDVLPEDGAERESFLSKTRLLVRIHNRFCNKGLPPPEDTLKARSIRERWYHLAGRAQRMLYRAMPLKTTQRWYINHVTRYNGRLRREGGCTVASFVPTYTYINTEDLLPYKDAAFEEITVKVPNRPEVFLTMQYGDYMRLPPRHKQVGHILVRYKADIGNPAGERNER